MKQQASYDFNQQAHVINTKPARPPSFFGSGFLNWAHRGASGHALENTLIAFHKAVEMGADGIECDIRETQDGQLVVFHDATLRRLAHRKEALATLSLDQLEKIPIGGKRAYPNARIPSLVRVLKEILPISLLNLEIKKATPQTLLNLIHASGNTHRVLLSSFDLPVLTRIRALDSDIAIGYLVDQERDATMLKTARKIRAQSLHLSIKGITEDEIARAHDAGLRVYVYTVNRLSEMRRLIAMGVDGLFTNDPDRLARLKQKKEVEC